MTKIKRRFAKGEKVAARLTSLKAYLESTKIVDGICNGMCTGIVVDSFHGTVVVRWGKDYVEYVPKDDLESVE